MIIFTRFSRCNRSHFFSKTKIYKRFPNIKLLSTYEITSITNHIRKKNKEPILNVAVVTHNNFIDTKFFPNFSSFKSNKVIYNYERIKLHESKVVTKSELSNFLFSTSLHYKLHVRGKLNTK